jgi:hypothetical protein
LFFFNILVIGLLITPKLLINFLYYPASLKKPLNSLIKLGVDQLLTASISLEYVETQFEEMMCLK